MLLKGILLGFSIAVPVGPIGLLCLRRGIQGGFWPAFYSGLGAASADALYGLVGALGLTVVSSVLLEQATLLRLFGGLFLLWLAWQGWRSAPAERAADAAANSLGRAYLSTLLLTLSNPMTILSFAAIFAGLGLAQGSAAGGVALVLGVFLGSALWWLLLAAMAATLGPRLHSRQLIWLNRLSALLLAGFAAWAFTGIK